MASPRDTTWIENRPTRGLARLDWGEILSYRDLLPILAKRDLKVRYKQAAFGVFWALAQPLMAAFVFSAVFSEMRGLRAAAPHYPLFAFLGFSVWTYVQATVTRASGSLVDHASLVTKIHFPRLVAPLAATLPGLVDLSLALLLFFPLALLGEVALGPRLLLLPLLVLPLWLVAAGPGILLAALHVRYRDVRHLIAVGLQLWFFASPVIYPLGILPDTVLRFVAWNPMTGVLGLFRWALLGAPLPGPELLLPGLLSAGLLLFLGLLVFARTDRRFADII